MNDRSEKWIVIVYDGCDKIDSHTFRGDHKDVNTEASSWIGKYHTGRDWVLHNIMEK